MTETKWTITAIKEAMAARGSHWWSKDTLKFFGTKVASPVYQAERIAIWAKNDDGLPRYRRWVSQVLGIA